MKKEWPTWTSWLKKRLWTQFDDRLLRNYLVLASHLYYASATIGKRWGTLSQTEKNEFGMFLMKSNLASLFKKIPRHLRNLLSSKAEETAAKIAELADPLIEADGATPEVVVKKKDLVRALKGKSKNIVSRIVKEESAEIKTEKVGPTAGTDEQYAMIVENRKVEQMLNRPQWMSVADVEATIDGLVNMLQQVNRTT